MEWIMYAVIGLACLTMLVSIYFVNDIVKYCLNHGYENVLCAGLVVAGIGVFIVPAARVVSASSVSAKVQSVCSSVATVTFSSVIVAAACAGIMWFIGYLMTHRVSVSLVVHSEKR